MEKRIRLSIYIDRLNGSPLASNFDEARSLIEKTLNSVEKEFSGVPYNPSNWRNDGRMYPPSDDFEQRSNLKGVRLFHSKGHKIYIAVNGAIKIISRKDVDLILVDKPGKDGKRCP